MESLYAVILKTEFFKSNYRVYTAKVPPRGFSSLTFRLSGKVSISVTGASMVSDAGSLTYIPAGCGYETQVLEAGEMLVMHYAVMPGTEDFCSQPMVLKPQHPEVFINLFTRAIRATGFDRMADCYRLLAEAQRAFFPTPVPNKKLQAIRAYIDENFCNADLNIPDLAERFGTSQVYFRKEFKKHYGLTPIEYIKKRRLDLACQLLRTNLYTVAEVAIRSGFDSISYFSSEFHRHFGCSPRDYRNL